MRHNLQTKKSPPSALRAHEDCVAKWKIVRAAAAI
jgi:hypothetical protein